MRGKLRCRYAFPSSRSESCDGPGNVCPPRVPLPGGPVVEIQLTEWVISNRYTGKPIEVISDEEMTERFGGAADTVEE